LGDIVDYGWHGVVALAPTGYIGWQAGMTRQPYAIVDFIPQPVTKTLASDLYS
jgi:hypothetical protein